MDLVVNPPPPPQALLLHFFRESQHFIGAFVRTRGAHFYRRSATDKRALESCVTLLYSQMVYEMCVRACVSITLCVSRSTAVTYPSQPSFSLHIKAVLQKV